MAKRTLITTDVRGVLTVTLNRPEKRNAFDGDMAKDLLAVFEGASRNDTIRAIVIRGTPPVFCAGGDIAWMLESALGSEERRLKEAMLISNLFDAIDRCSKPTVAVVQGAAFGGAMGILAASDFVLSTQDSVFGTSEVSLGIVPACVAPFLIAKIGPRLSRQMFLSGTSISASHAREIGLVDEFAATPRDVDQLLDSRLESLAKLSPLAQKASKALAREMIYGDDEAWAAKRQHTIRFLAESWASEDGIEGMTAFLYKTVPRWRQ